MSQGTIANVISAAVAITGELAAACAGRVPAVPYLIGLGIDELSGLIEALPPGTQDMAFYRNWAESSRALWENGEGGASSYQLTQMQRKLDRLQGEWT
jgi:hypothetical protein